VSFPPYAKASAAGTTAEGLRALPFFPKSYRLCAATPPKKERRSALNAARRTEGDSQSRGEADDPYYQLNWGKVDALDERFTALALGIFGPLLAHEEELEL
jgi:hypothetical protein